MIEITVEVQGKTIQLPTLPSGSMTDASEINGGIIHWLPIADDKYSVFKTPIGQSEEILGVLRVTAAIPENVHILATLRKGEEFETPFLSEKFGPAFLTLKYV